MTNRKDFLQNEFPKLLQNLTAETKGNFGLMTPQHMVEHLTWVIKSTLKGVGVHEMPLTEKQKGFRKFIDKGAILKHRPSDKTKDDLPDLKYGSLEEAMEQIPIAVNRFYEWKEANPDGEIFAPFTGHMPIEKWELFHYSHVRYHLWQFGLLPEYP